MRYGIVCLYLLLTCVSTSLLNAADPLPRLKVSDNKRFLVKENGQPFFWLGDTAWELFHRLNREEAEKYLSTRAQQGFTVVQAVALAELDGLNTPNANGHHPFIDNDPLKPNETAGPNNDYWDHVDWIVKRANERGIYVGMLPTWGDKWNRKSGAGPEIFNPQNVEAYGKWLATRYKDAGIIWILGGDRPIDQEVHTEITRALARGLKAGDNGAHLMTWHPNGGHGSSEHFHADYWLDFNMRQNGHVAEFNPRYLMTSEDYRRSPTKPVIDGEPLYEDHPLSFRANDFGHSTATDVRAPLYWDLFSGAFGHTYGHHSVWQMWQPGRTPVNNPLMPWYEAIYQPGANQMQHGRRLIESRPFLSRVPDDSFLVTSNIPTAFPGTGRYHFAATRDAMGTYAMVYAPTGRKFTVQLDKVNGPNVTVWVYDPRTGHASWYGEFPASGQKTFQSPTPGENLDWVWVFDESAKQYPPPGYFSPRNE